jgi:hypothetical protein
MRGRKSRTVREIIQTIHRTHVHRSELALTAWIQTGLQFFCVGIHLLLSGFLIATIYHLVTRGFAVPMEPYFSKGASQVSPTSNLAWGMVCWLLFFGMSRYGRIFHKARQLRRLGSHLFR